MLEIKDLSLTFGGVQALMELNLKVEKKEILAVIGPNGAGKSCVLNCMNGFYHPQKGNIHFWGKEITGMASHKIAELGLGRTFQNIQLYTGLSTLDNLMAARHFHIKSCLIRGALYFGPALREEIDSRIAVERVMDFMEIEHLRRKTVDTLPYGIRKRIELARALVQEPKMLLLDEPMAGMNFEEKEDMARFIIDIFEERNIPIILVEHDMGVVMDLADRIIALDFGRKIAEGPPDEIRNNEKVIAAYLGED
ncbi:MAG: ABC transporter ATP-binding protein [Desulfobacteraceae bacterium 4484_190.1]|nr:MAG: ABC transporter ATP-binding protein [Desulfobacteraceae bacterium 4484_190.1]